MLKSLNYTEIEILCKSRKNKIQNKYKSIHIYTKKDEKMILKHMKDIQSRSC